MGSLSTPAAGGVRLGQRLSFGPITGGACLQVEFRVEGFRV